MWFQSPFQGIDFYFTADTLRALAPLQLDCLDAVLVDYIFSDAKARVLDVHLYEHFPLIAFVPAIGFNSPIHVGGFRYFMVLIELELRIDTAHVFPAHDGNSRYGGTNRKVFPVFPGNFG